LEEHAMKMQGLILNTVLTLGILSTTTGCGALTGYWSRTGPAAIIIDREGDHATNMDVAATKTGTACTYNVLGVVAFGDGSIDAAKRGGQITHVASVDYDYMNIIANFGHVCTVVRGS
jgi:hypothetical protein